MFTRTLMLLACAGLLTFCSGQIVDSKYNRADLSEPINHFHTMYLQSTFSLSSHLLCLASCNEDPACRMATFQPATSACMLFNRAASHCSLNSSSSVNTYVKYKPNNCALDESTDGWSCSMLTEFIFRT